MVWSKDMNKQIRRRVVGFVLIEALVALVVVAVGVLGIGKLSALLLRGTGESKTRAEALQVAQDRVEKARDFQLGTGTGTGCGSLTNETAQAVTGVNASYAVTSTFTNIAGADARAMEVCVTWDGGTCTGTTNRIILRTSVTCEGMGTSAQVGTGGASNALGGFIKTPTGRGKVGGGTVVAGGTPNEIEISPGNTIQDGTRTALSGDGATRYLTDSSGNVLLTMAKLDCETSAPEFSTISGTVFVEAKNGAAIASESNLKILSSDASYCAVLPYNDSRVMPSGASGNSIKYFYTYYQCYVGAEWWGNIGLVRLDNANANNRVCQGSPVNSNTGTIFSKHPQINSSRGYRGYREIGGTGSGIYESKGIGEQESLAGGACPTNSRVYVPQSLRNHHFVHASISGQVNDSACNSVETDLKALTPLNLLDTGTGAPDSTGSTTAKTVLTAVNNPGKFYCMSNSDGVSCADLISNPTPPTTLLTGTITPDSGVNLTGSTIEQAGLAESCTASSLVVNNNGTSYNYSCQINWTGFPGSSWNGLISFILPGNVTLCASASGASVVPTSATVNYSIQDRSALPTSSPASAPNSINFTSIPVAATSITLNLTAKDSTCGVGVPGQVNAEWTNNQSPIVWNAVANASMYEIERCINTNKNSLTICTTGFSVVVASQAGTSYSPSTPSSKDTHCYRVRGIGAGTGNYGAWSPSRCIYYKDAQGQSPAVTTYN